MTDGSKTVDIARAEAVTDEYHGVLAWFAAPYIVGGALGNLGMGFVRMGERFEIVGMLITSAALAFGLVAMVRAARHAYALKFATGSPQPFAFFLAMLVPVFGIIVLILVANSALTWYRNHSIPSGLLGPTAKTLGELQRRSAGVIPDDVPEDPEHPERDADYVRDARASGMDDGEIVRLLVEAGWDEQEAREWVESG